MRFQATLAAIVLTALLCLCLQQLFVQVRLEHKVGEMKDTIQNLQEEAISLKRGLAKVEAKLRERVEFLSANSPK
jgi:hypothetical protein